MKEITAKCQKELAGFHRALRNVAFLFSVAFGILRPVSQMDFIDLSCVSQPPSLQQ